MISMKGYQPKKVDISKVKPPKCLVEYKIPEYEYKVGCDDNSYGVERLLNDGWSVFNVINHLIIFRKEKDVKEIQD